MNKRIRSYDELLIEKRRLEILLQSQKELIAEDLHIIKNDLQPAIDTISFLGKITTRDNRGLLITGAANQVIDLVFKKVILNRAGWLTKQIVPFFLKNFSSHYIAEHKDEWVRKLFSWVSHKNSNGEATPGSY